MLELEIMWGVIQLELETHYYFNPVGAGASLS
jgi:hypothetical protein